MKRAGCHFAILHPDVLSTVLSTVFIHTEIRRSCTTSTRKQRVKLYNRILLPYKLYGRYAK